jgi:hypothetical protein
MLLRIGIVNLAIGLTIGALASDARSADVPALLTTIQRVGPEGRGDGPARTAWQHLTHCDAKQVPVILAGLDSAQPLAANWIRAAVDTIVEGTLADGGSLPVKELEKFLADRNHDPRARRFAFELIARVDFTAADRLIPDMLDDPSLEMRRDAVARVLDDATQKLSTDDKQAAVAAFETAVKAARDEDQIKLASDKLKELGHPVNLPRLFGFVMQWKLIGPFDNAAQKGFSFAYPPEQRIDFAADYPGKEKSVTWIDHTTTDDYGAVDLNAAIGKHMGAATYAVATFRSDTARPVELRLGSDDAVKVWLNGKEIISAEVYHALTKLDQYVGRGELKADDNVILVKVCQNEQTDSWAQDWKFQLRVCDAVGTAVLSTDRTALRTAIEPLSKP